MTLKAVIFDFGGVLYRLPDHSWLRRWQRLLNFKDDDVLLSLMNNPQESDLLMDILTGRLPEEEMWETFARRWHIRPALMKRVRKALASKRRLNHDLARFMTGLRKQYITAILSNAGTEARGMFSEVYGLDKIADLMVISAEEGIAKPDERIYEITLQRLAIEPQEAIFLDDMAENVESARAYGLHAIQFENNEQAMRAVNRLIAELG